MRDLAALEIRRLHEKIERAERRIALQTLPGKVKEKDAQKRLLRLQIGTSSDGRPVLGPWSRWQEATAGGMKIHSEPADNEQMLLVSQSGTVGAASIATPGTYDKDHEAPSTSSDTAVLERGGGRIELGPNGIRLRGNVDIGGGILTHEDVNVGHDHAHTKVFTGEDLSGPPEP